jgi:hypothetical protein
VGRVAGRDEAHLVEAELPARLAGDDQVADVGRVEGAAEDADPAAPPAVVSGGGRGP